MTSEWNYLKSCPFVRTPDDENSGALEWGKDNPSRRKTEANAESRGHFLGKKMIGPLHCNQEDGRERSASKQARSWGKT